MNLDNIPGRKLRDDETEIYNESPYNWNAEKVELWAKLKAPRPAKCKARCMQYCYDAVKKYWWTNLKQ